jgi:hypothetical protein
MKTKLFKHGPYKYKAYLKPVGKGFEVGFLQGSKSLFVGNFINNQEAQAWYQLMNREYSRFAKKYWHAPTKASAAVFFHKFITNSLYKHYYDYLDKCFGKYTKNYHREYSRDVRTYNRMKKVWHIHEAPYTRRAS